MKLAELIGNDGELATVAIEWVKTTVSPGVCTCDSILDSMGHEDKLRLVRGLCGILIMWSYIRNNHEIYPCGKNELVVSIKREVEWKANADRQGLYAQYLTSNILTASNEEDEQEFYRQLGFLEPDENGPLFIRKRIIERVIQELSSWFRYYTWDHTWRGYGQSGQDNVRSALEDIKRNRVKTIEMEKQAWEAIVEPAVLDEDSAAFLEQDLIENPTKINTRVLAYMEAAYYEASTGEKNRKIPAGRT